MYHDRDTFDFSQSQGHVINNQPMAVPFLVEWKSRNITIRDDTTLIPVSYGTENGQQKRGTCSITLLQKELKLNSLYK